MHKLSIVTAAAAAAVSLMSVAALTGPAFAQRQPPSITHVPSTPNQTYSPSTYSCQNQLGYLRRVYEEQLDQINSPNRVAVTPVCLGEDFGHIRNEGNAGALRASIADNEAMLLALRSKKFRPDDVVGVRMTGENAVLLYVHPFHQ
jgi:hypothetical protein